MNLIWTVSGVMLTNNRSASLLNTLLQQELVVIINHEYIIKDISALASQLGIEIDRSYTQSISDQAKQMYEAYLTTLINQSDDSTHHVHQIKQSLQLGTQAPQFYWISHYHEDGHILCHLKPLSHLIWQRRLLSKQLGLHGFKHDLSNRIFLLSALPQLAEFSDASELMQDLLVELPNTLQFFNQRLPAHLTESQSATTTINITQWIQTLGQWKDEIQKTFAVSFSLDIPNEMTHNIGNLPLKSKLYIGLYWSLHVLALMSKYVKHSQLTSHSSHPVYNIFASSDLTLTLAHKQLHHTDQLSYDQQLIIPGEYIQLTLCTESHSLPLLFEDYQQFEQKELALFLDEWTAGFAWQSLEQLNVLWYSTWVNAAQMLQAHLEMEVNSEHVKYMIFIPLISK